MEKVFVWLGVFVLLISGVFALIGEWDSVNVGDDVGGGSSISGEGVGSQDVGKVDDYVVSDEVADEYIEDDYVPVSLETSQGSGDGTFYTPEFYMALILGIVVLGIVGVVVWSLIRGPRNKWEK